jgi:hypothetical protein
MFVDNDFQETISEYYILAWFPEQCRHCNNIALHDVSSRSSFGRLTVAKISLNKHNYMELLKAFCITISHYLCSFPHLSCLCSHESVLYMHGQLIRAQRCGAGGTRGTTSPVAAHPGCKPAPGVGGCVTLISHITRYVKKKTLV